MRIPVIILVAAATLVIASEKSSAFEVRIGAVYPSAFDRVCFPTEIFIAEVLSASPADCELRDPSVSLRNFTGLTCDPKNDLTFRIRVDETLALNSQELELSKLRPVRPDDDIDVFINVFNRLPTDVGGEFPPEDEFGLLKIDPPTAEPLSAQQISDRFVGQKFIFGIRPNPYDRTHIPVAIVWTMKLHQWVADSLRNAEDHLPDSVNRCSRLVRKDYRP